MVILNKYCGVTNNNDNSWTSTPRLYITSTFVNQVLTPYKYSFEAYNDSTLIGGSFAYGKKTCYFKFSLNRLYYILLASCSSNKLEYDFSENKNLFFEKLLRTIDDGDIEVLSLKCYYFENGYFYNVIYEDNLSDTIDSVYVFRYKGLSDWFNILNGEEYFPIQYDKFISANENGVLKIYNEDEINYLIRNFFIVISIKRI